MKKRRAISIITAASLALNACSAQVPASPEFIKARQADLASLQNIGVCPPDSELPNIYKQTHSDIVQFDEGPPPSIVVGDRIPFEMHSSAGIHELTHFCGLQKREYTQTYIYSDFTVTGEKGYRLMGHDFMGEASINYLEEGYAMYVELHASGEDMSVYFKKRAELGLPAKEYYEQMLFYLSVCELAGHDPLINIGFLALLEQMLGHEIATQEEFTSYMKIFNDYRYQSISFEKMRLSLAGLAQR